VKTGRRRWLQRGMSAVAAVTAALLVCRPGAAKGPEQDFSDDAAYKVEAYYGGADLKATRAEKPSPSGGPAVSIKFRSTRDNSGATIAWNIPPQVLDKDAFTMQIKTPGGAVPYVRCLFFDAQGQRIRRNNYFSVSAPDWKPIRFAVGSGSGAASNEPAELTPGQEVAKIVLQFCGKGDREYQVLLADFRKADSEAPPKAAPAKKGAAQPKAPRDRKLAAKPPAKPDS